MPDNVWYLTDPNRPWTANTERTWHHMKRAQVVKECRNRFYWLAKQEGIPKCDRISISAIPLAKDRRWRPDVAACYPTVKSAIDGLVDAGVIPDDNDKHLHRICFHPVEVVGFDGIRIVVWREQ